MENGLWVITYVKIYRGFNPGRVFAVTLKNTVNLLATHVESEEELEWPISV